MSTVEQVEAAIQKLPREDFFRLHEWIRDRFDDEWDKQFEEDARSNRLDHVAREALAEYRAGQSKPFFSFPNSIWERTCRGNSIADPRPTA